MRLTLLLCVVLTSTASGQTLPSSPPLMTRVGKILLVDDLAGPLDKSWVVAKGKYEPANGALKATELADDKHAAVMRRKVDLGDAIVEFRVKLDGAKVVALSINGAKGHVCRLRMNAEGFGVQRDDTDGKTGPDKAVVLETVKTELKPGEWHTVRVEMRGDEMLAQINGKAVAYGRHEGLKAAKKDIGLVVGGESASFKDLRVWSAEPNPSWDPASLKK